MKIEKNKTVFVWLKFLWRCFIEENFEQHWFEKKRLIFAFEKREWNIRDEIDCYLLKEQDFLIWYKLTQAFIIENFNIKFIAEAVI